MCVVDGRTHVMSGCGRGHYLGGTLFDRVTPEMTIYQEEIFGPVLCCVRVSTLDEAIGLINRNEFGNGAVCFTRDGATAQRFTRSFRTRLRVRLRCAASCRMLPSAL